MREKKQTAGSFVSTLAFISRIRIPLKKRPDLRGMLFFMPIVGLCISLLLFGLYSGLSRIFPDPFFTVLLITVLQYFLFNLFHFDGFLDTADAFSCFADREKRLKILKDLQLGSFAFFFGAVYLAAKLYMLTKSSVYFQISSLPPVSRGAFLLFFFSFPAAGRAAAALLPLAMRPAKAEGLGSMLKENKPWTALPGSILAFIPPLGFFLAALFLEGSLSPIFLTVFAAPILSFIATSLLYGKKVGGYTGDAFGFAVETGELLYISIFYLLLTYGLG